MDKVWLQHYPTGIPATIEDQAQQYSSLLDVFEQSCTEFAQRTAYISMGKRMSYRELSTNAHGLGQLAAKCRNQERGPCRPDDAQYAAIPHQSVWGIAQWGYHY